MWDPTWANRPKALLEQSFMASQVYEGISLSMDLELSLFCFSSCFKIIGMWV